MLLLLLPLLWEGSLSQTLEVQPLVTVQKGMCVHVPCAFEYQKNFLSGTIPVYGYWFRKGMYGINDNLVATNEPNRVVEKGAEGRFHLLGDPRMKNCSLSITDAKFLDSGRYYFHFEKGNEKWTYKEKLLNVEVTDLIQKPDISIPEVLESGKTVTLNCTFPWTCGVNKSFTFSWMGAALPYKTQHPRPSLSSEISFIPGPQHHGTNLTCQVTLPGGCLTSERTIQLNVSYPVQNVSITMEQDNRTTVFIPENSPALVVQEGRSLQLLCAANSNPPATLSWILRNQTLASAQPSEDGVLPLDLPHLGPADGGNYTCLAQHPLGSKQASLNVSVHYEPTPSHEFPKAPILGILCGVGATSLLALCLLLLVKLLRKKSAAAASRGREQDPKRPSCGDLSLNPISPAAGTAPTPAATEDGPVEVHYACLNFQGVTAKKDHGSTNPLTENSEKRFQ